MTVVGRRLAAALGRITPPAVIEFPVSRRKFNGELWELCARRVNALARGSASPNIWLVLISASPHEHLAFLRVLRLRCRLLFRWVLIAAILPFAEHLRSAVGDSGIAAPDD